MLVLMMVEKETTAVSQEAGETLGVEGMDMEK